MPFKLICFELLETQPASTYFGTKYTKDTYTNVVYEWPEPIKSWMNGLHYKSILEIAKEDRCPCPKVPTTLPPEIQTKRYYAIRICVTAKLNLR